MAKQRITSKESRNWNRNSSWGLKQWFLLIIGTVGVLSFILGVLLGYIVLFSRDLSDNTVIVFDFNFLDIEIEHYIFSIANALLIGFYLAIIIPISGRRDKRLNILLICGVVIIAIANLGYLGVYLYLDFPFLVEHTFISNQKEGTWFFIKNMGFWTLIYASSFLIQSEID